MPLPKGSRTPHGEQRREVILDFLRHRPQGAYVDDVLIHIDHEIDRDSLRRFLKRMESEGTVRIVPAARKVFLFHKQGESRSKYFAVE